MLEPLTEMELPVSRPIEPNAPVIVTNGAPPRAFAASLAERARVTFGDTPVWAVEFPLPLGVRSIREDWLQRSEVLS